MKRLLIVFTAVWLTVSGFAQTTADIGLWGGTSGYIGDLDLNRVFPAFNLNYGGYFRYNFNARVGLRAMIVNGKFSDNGTVENYPWAFNKNVQDISLQIEINYLKYILGVKNTPFTSYVMAGFGVANFRYNLNPAEIAMFNPEHNKGNAVKTNSVMTNTLPFGIGFKYTLGKRLGMGIEYQMRKLFTDKLDDLDDPLAFIDQQGKEITYTDQWHNNDWSAYLGIHVTYKIYMGKKACPTYDSKN